MWVKICGLTSHADAEIAIEAGADAVGFVIEPTSPRYVQHPVAREICQSLESEVKRIAVMGPFQETWNSSHFDGVQALGLWDRAISAELVSIGAYRPTSLVFPDFEFPVDYLVIDPFDAKQFGGTGKTFDPGFAAEIVSLSPFPVILAGGLTPENVGEMIQKIKPFGVDVSSGVESEARLKDHGKVRAFIQAARSS